MRIDFQHDTDTFSTAAGHGIRISFPACAVQYIHIRRETPTAKEEQAM